MDCSEKFIFQSSFFNSEILIQCGGSIQHWGKLNLKVKLKNQMEMNKRMTRMMWTSETARYKNGHQL